MIIIFLIVFTLFGRLFKKRFKYFKLLYLLISLLISIVISIVIIYIQIIPKVNSWKKFDAFVSEYPYRTYSFSPGGIDARPFYSDSFTIDESQTKLFINKVTSKLNGMGYMLNKERSYNYESYVYELDSPPPKSYDNFEYREFYITYTNNSDNSITLYMHRDFLQQNKLNLNITMEDINLLK